ncbi:fatty acyl-CoA reductase wat, partial [Cryptotermes secundus]
NGLLNNSSCNLQAFVHISTAYSNCIMKEIDEKFYMPAMRWTEVVQLVESLDQETTEIITPLVLGEWPNTYSFTKALAEDLIRDEARGLPIGILRPSIVVNTASEPVVAWMNNVYGAAGVVIGAGVGLLKSLHCDKDIAADIVPVDMAINAALAIAWEVAQHTSENKPVQYLNTEIKTTSKNEDIIPVYNYISSAQNPIMWGEFMKLSEYGLNFPSLKFVWYYFFTLNKHRFIHNIYIVFLHLLPALITDVGAKIMGKKPIMWKTYQKISKFTDVISYFSTKQWNFHNNNVQNLWKRMNPQDKILFKFDMALLDWEVYFASAGKGLRFYVLRDSFECLEEARTRYQRLKYLHYTIFYSVQLILLYVAYKIVLHYWITFKDVLLEILQ